MLEDLTLANTRVNFVGQHVKYTVGYVMIMSFVIL